MRVKSIPGSARGNDPDSGSLTFTRKAPEFHDCTGSVVNSLLLEIIVLVKATTQACLFAPFPYRGDVVLVNVGHQ
jgi:hypothetical protein